MFSLPINLIKKVYIYIYKLFHNNQLLILLKVANKFTTLVLGSNASLKFEKNIHKNSDQLKKSV